MKLTNLNLLSRALSVVLLFLGLALTGCYDDGAVWKQLIDLELRVKELERLCSQTNTNIEALQTIVSALQDKDYVTGVAQIKEGDKVLGYTITFSKSDAVTIYHGKDGQNGNDGRVPSLGVKQDGDEWYWTVDGQWLTDADGNKVRASAKDGQDGKPGVDGKPGNDVKPGNDGAAGVTPTLKIEEGYWYVSYDGGKTWEPESLGQATGDRGDSMFKKVSYDDDYVYITMADGQQLTLPRTSVSQSEGSVGPATISLTQITATTATFNGHLDVLASNLPISQITIYYSDAETFHVSSAQTVTVTSFDENQNFTLTLDNLKSDTKYSYCVYVKVKSEESCSDVLEFTTKQAPMFFKVPIMGVDFAVFGYAHDGDGGYSPESGVVDLYMDEVRCAYVSEGVTGVKDAWKPLTDNYYWPQAKSLAFIAASPSQGVPAPECGYNISSTKSALTIEYTDPDDLEKQVDILYSDWKTDCVKDACAAEGVELAFNHALSSVCIKARVREGLEEVLKVDGISIDNIYRSGVFTSDFEVGAQAWDFTGQTRGRYVSDAKLINFEKFVLPQTLDEDSFITVRFSIKYNGGELSQACNLNLKDAIDEWVMGKRYTYHITVHLDMGYLETSVSDWDNVEIDSDTLQ